MIGGERYVLAGVAAAVLVTILPAVAMAYSGSLSSADIEPGILGTGNWIATGPTVLTWDVAQIPGGQWHYSYTFTHPPGATSHFIIETSANFTTDDISNLTGDVGEVEIGWHGAGGGANPTMPEAIYGVKIGTDGVSTHLEFDSTRIPMWGDFYAKDGTAGGFGLNSAWNAGFTACDCDPETPPQDGSVACHVLVPNTHFTPVERTSWGALKFAFR